MALPIDDELDPLARYAADLKAACGPELLASVRARALARQSPVVAHEHARRLAGAGVVLDAGALRAYATRLAAHRGPAASAPDLLHFADAELPAGAAVLAAQRMPAEAFATHAHLRRPTAAALLYGSLKGAVPLPGEEAEKAKKETETEQEAAQEADEYVIVAEHEEGPTEAKKKEKKEKNSEAKQQQPAAAPPALIKADAILAHACSAAQFVADAKRRASPPDAAFERELAEAKAREQDAKRRIVEATAKAAADAEAEARAAEEAAEARAAAEEAAKAEARRKQRQAEAEARRAKEAEAEEAERQRAIEKKQQKEARQREKEERKRAKEMEKAKELKRAQERAAAAEAQAAAVATVAAAAPANELERLCAASPPSPAPKLAAAAAPSPAAPRSLVVLVDARRAPDADTVRSLVADARVAFGLTADDVVLTCHSGGGDATLYTEAAARGVDDGARVVAEAVREEETEANARTGQDVTHLSVFPARELEKEESELVEDVHRLKGYARLADGVEACALELRLTSAHAA